MAKRLKLTRVTMAVATLALVAASVTPGLATAGQTTLLVSKSSSGTQGNFGSLQPTISKTGRYIAFHSYANNLVPGDTNEVADCFVRDEGGKTTERVSISSEGNQANGYCGPKPAISQDGRYVAFESTATNLGGSTNGIPQVYLHDRVTATTILVSRRLGGGQGGDGPSRNPAISGDGQFVVYESVATDLVGNDTNRATDIFLYDRDTDKTRRVSVRSNGRQANRGSRNPAISADGRAIAFDSAATNLIKKDSNGKRDVFIHNRVSKKTARVSVRSNGGQANGGSHNPAVSGNGRFVAFDSVATNLAGRDANGQRDVYLRDRKLGKTIQISVNNKQKLGTGASGNPTISNSGRYIAFKSTAPDLVRNDTNRDYDVFVRDHVGKTTKRVSLTAAGRQALGGSSYAPRISGDGRYVAFQSWASNIVANDDNGTVDIFRRGPLR